MFFPIVSTQADVGEIAEVAGRIALPLLPQSLTVNGCAPQVFRLSPLGPNPANGQGNGANALLCRALLPRITPFGLTLNRVEIGRHPGRNATGVTWFEGNTPCQMRRSTRSSAGFVRRERRRLLP